MKRSISTILGVVVAMGLLAPWARAGMVLYLDDPATAGIDVIIADGAPAGTLTGMGVSSLGDGLADGIITFNGALFGSVFAVNVTTGISKPVIGPVRIDLNSVNVTGVGPGMLEIGLTDTDFLLDATTDVIVLSDLGGLSDGTVTSRWMFDEGNEEFGIGSFASGSLGPFGPGAFSGSSDIPGTASGPFALSQVVTINHGQGGDVASFDSIVEVVPEPTTLLLSVIGLGFLGRRRRGR